MRRGILEALLFGILEGVTEWLPVSSTGHLILLQGVLQAPWEARFLSLFEVVIQLGAILAVPTLFFTPLWPFSRKKMALERKSTWLLWGKILLATLPAALAGALLEDILDSYLYSVPTVAVALILYGILFLILEKSKRAPRILAVESLGVKDALMIGCFQVLSLVPGTSRSGSTVLGGMMIGADRATAAFFSFYLAIPVMLGASLLKTAKFFLSGEVLCSEEWILLGTGVLTAYLVSLSVIRFLLDFVRRHSFVAFGMYRILLGVAVLLTLLKKG